MSRQISHTKDEEVNELLHHIEHSQLKAFIAEYAHQHASFKQDIFTYFNPQEPQKSISDYRDIVSAAFDFEPTGRYSKGYDFYKAASDAGDEFSSLLEKAGYFIIKNNFEEAAAIAQSIIETIPRNYERVDDSDGELGTVFDDAAGLLLQIAENEKAGRELKKEIFYWVGKEMKEKIYSDYGFDKIYSLLIPYTRAAGLYEEALQITDERIQMAENDYGLESVVNDKISLMQQNNHADEAEWVINSYMELASIRKIRINKILGEKRYQEAVNLIEEGIQIAAKNGYSGTEIEWKDQLLELYIRMADHNNILKHAEDLFYNGRDEMKYYHILKNETEAEKWEDYLDALLLRNDKKAGPRSVSNFVLGLIYIEEKYWERLLQHVEKVDLGAVEQYEQYLKPIFPDKLRNLLVEKLLLYAGRNVGRDHYRYVAAILKKIRTYPEGNKIVEKLLAEFKIKYKTRRAVMEELRGV